MASHEGDDILTPYETAAVLRVAPATVRTWARKGLLRACTTPGGHRRRILEAGAEQCLSRPLDEPALLTALGLKPEPS